MKKKFIIFIAIISILAFSIPVYADEVTNSGVTTGSGSTQYYYTVYPTNTLNQNVIDKWNELTPYQKHQLMPYYSVMFFKSLGILSKDSYAKMNAYYNAELEYEQTRWSSANEFRENTSNQNIIDAYTYDTGRVGNGVAIYAWYENFDDWLAQHITLDSGVLVLDHSETIYDIYNGVIQEEQEENGIINVELYSYQNINSSNFGNVSQYSSFMGLCRQNLDKGFVIIAKENPSGGGHIYVGFPSVATNIYNNGITLGNTIQMIDSNGTQNYSIQWYKTTAYNSNQDTQFSISNRNARVRNMRASGATIPTGVNVDGISNGYAMDGYGIYTLQGDKANYQLFTSLSGWINHKGHYEPTYQLGPNYGSVPSAVITSTQITTYYQQTYGGDTTSITGDTYIYYPPTYDPTGTGYDSEHQTLSFDGITAFLSSLGSLIGSLINGLAQGLANIINSLASIVNNLRENLLQGVIFEFLSTFIGWLPSEIIALITALFAVTVIFALIKLIKGFF